MKRAAILTLLVLTSLCLWQVCRKHHAPHAVTAHAADTPACAPKGIPVAHVRPFSVPAVKPGARTPSMVMAKPAATATKADASRLAAVKSNLLSMPLHFEENRGQAPAQYDFLSRGRNCSVLLRSNEARILVADKKGAASASLKLEAAAGDRKGVAMEPLAAKMNYYRGKNPSKWQVGVPTDAKVKYEGVYPGIDVVYYGNQQKLEYDFVVAPHADPNTICWNAVEVDSMKLDKEGSLVLTIGGHEVLLKKPVAYQIENGTRKLVDVTYRVAGKQIRFALGSYDADQRLVIDPIVQFAYSTYLGGTTGDAVNAVAVDRQGRVYVAGWSLGTGAFPVAGNPPPPTGTFPVGSTAGYVAPYQATHAADSNRDAFVAILSADMSEILFATYLGGDASDSATCIALDPSGNIYVGGNTSSDDFPMLNPAQWVIDAGNDGFVSELANNGTLVYSTYIGDCTVRGIGVDSSGGVCVVGSTPSAFFYGHTPEQPGTSQAKFSLSVTKRIVAADGSEMDSTQTTTPISEYGGASAIAAGLNNLNLVSQEGYFTAYPKHKMAGSNATQRTYDLTLALSGTDRYMLSGGITTGTFPSVTVDAETYLSSAYLRLPFGAGNWPAVYAPASQYVTVAGKDWPVVGGQACITGTTPYPVDAGGTTVTIAGTVYTIQSDYVPNYISYKGGDWPVFNGNAYVTGTTYYPANASGTTVTILGTTYPIYGPFVEINNTNYPVIGGTVTFASDLTFTNPDGGQATILTGSYSSYGTNAVSITETDAYAENMQANTVSVGGVNYPVIGGTVTVAGTPYTVNSGTVSIVAVKSWPIYSQFINIDGRNWPVQSGGAMVNGQTYCAYTMSVALGSGLSDAFALRLTCPSPGHPVIDTYNSHIIGGPGDDSINGIATDLNGVYYFAGQTQDLTKNGSVGGSFYYPMIGQVAGNISVIEFQNEGQMNAVAVDLNGYSYFGGTTGGSDFPMFNAFQTYPQTLDRSAPGDPMGSGYNGIIVKMDPGFANTIFSTYLGGSKHDYITGIAVDFQGYVYVTGETESIDFPTLGDASQQSSDRNHGNAFLSVLVPAGNELRYSTYFGGAETDWGFGVAVTPARDPKAYVVGYTNSDDFPTTPATVIPTSPYSDTYTSGFVTAFHDSTVDLELEAITTDLPVPIAGKQLTYTVTVKNLSPTVDCQDARVAQLLSSNLTYVSSAGANIQGFTGGSVDTTTNTVSVDLGPVLAGREVSYTVTVTVNSTGVISTSANVQAEHDIVSTNNSLTLQQTARPFVSLATTQPNASQNGTPGIFTVVRQGDPSPTLSIQYTIGGNATNGVNYQALSGTVTIPSGSGSANIVVAPYANTTSNPEPQTVVLNLVKGVNYEIGTYVTGTSLTPALFGSGLVQTATSGTVSITEVPADVVNLAIPDPTGSKNSGDPIVFTVSRTGVIGQALTVSFNLFGTATNGIDYQITGDNNTLVTGTAGSITIPANTTSVNITVLPIPDSISGQPTNNTTVGLALVTTAQTATSPGSGYVLGATKSLSGTLLDVTPDTVSVVKVADAYASGTAGKFTITRSGDPSNLVNALPVQYTMGGTAISGSDYNALSGVATIPAGSASVDVPITPILNITGTVDKSAVLTLSPTPNAKAYTLGTGSMATVTIYHYAGTVLTVSTPLQVPATAAATGTTTGTYLISRTGSTNNPLTVYYSMGGSANSGVDYQPLPLSGTIAAGAAQLAVTLTPLANGLTSGSETATLTIQPTSAGDYLPGTPGSASVTIVNNSGIVRPVVTLSVISNEASLTSGSGILIFRVTRTGDVSQAVSVNYSTGGSAINGADYQTLTGAIAMPANVATADIVVTPIWSNTVQPVKIVSIALAAGNDYDLGAVTYGTGSIDFPNNPAMNLTVITGSASGVSGALDFLVTRTGGTNQAISVNYTTGGSAVNGVDYQPLTGNIAFPAGVTSEHVLVTPIWTGGVKQDQVMTIQLATGSGYALGANTFGSGAIVYVPWDVASVAVSGTNVISESGTANAVFQISRTGDLTKAITVNYTMGGTAVSGSNYQPVSGSVVIAAGGSSANVVVTPYNAHSDIPFNTITLTLAAGTGYTASSSASAMVTITSGEPVVTLVLSNTNIVTQTTGTLCFLATRTGDLSKPSTVQYTMGGTAANGVDYQSLTGLIVFQPVSGASTQTGTINVVPIWTGATVAKTVALQLTSGSDYVLGASIGDIGTITPVGWDGVILGVQAPTSVSESGSDGSLKFLVTRTNDLNQPIVFNYTLAGSAVSGVNYAPVSGSVAIVAGSSTAVIAVTPINAGMTVPSSTVILNAAPGFGYSATGVVSATATITSANPSMSVAVDGSASAITQTTGPLKFHVTRTGGDLSQVVTVNYTLGGSAVSGVDYQTMPGAVTFLAGSGTADILINPIWTGGAVAKSVTVQLAGGAGYWLSGSNTAAGTIAPVGWDVVAASITGTNSVSESGTSGNLQFVLKRSGDLSSSITVNYTMGGTAVSGSNYAPVYGSVTIPSGTNSAIVQVIPLNANSSTPSKTVTLTVAAGTDYTPDPLSPMAGGVITSANPVVNIALSGASSTPQTSGSLVFQIKRGGDLSKAIAVSYSLGGSAVAGVDYQSIGGAVAFASGADTATVVVRPIWTGGTVDKTVSIQLTTGVGYVVDESTMTAAGTITAVSFDTVNLALSGAGSIAESNTTGSLNYQVTRTGDLTLPVTVNYTMGGTALSGVNYQPVTGQVTIPSSSSNAVVSVTPLDAHTTVLSQTVIVTLASGTCYNIGAPATVTGTITSEYPAVSITPITSVATQTGSTNVIQFLVSRPAASSSNALSVNYTLSGAAVNGDDYQTIATSVALPAGGTSAVINIIPIWGTTYKPAKTVIVQLGAGTSYVVSDNNTASGTIDFPNLPQVNLSVPTPEALSGSGQVVFLVSRGTDSASIANAITVNYAVAGTAVSGSDYSALPGSLSLPAGVSSGTITVMPNWSGNPRPVKSISIQLTTGNNYVLGSTTYGAGTIDFVDSSLVNVSVYSDGIAYPPVSGVSSTNNSIWFIVTRGTDSVSIAKTITVNVTMGGSAIANQDYMGSLSGVVMQAGVSTVWVRIIPIWANTAKPSADTVTMQLTDGTGYKLGGTTYASGAINWPGEPGVSVAVQSPGIAALDGSDNYITFVVTRGTDSTSTAQPISVTYTLGGNAVYGTDYQAYTGTMDPSHTIVLPAGSSSAAVVIVPNWSSQVKPIKLVTISLSSVGNGYLLTPNVFAQGTINFPGYPEVNLSVTNPVAVEGSGSGAVIFTVSRTDATKAISVNYTTGGSAANGVDYQTLPYSVALPVGCYSADILVIPQWATGVAGANANNSVKIVSAQLVSGVGYVLGPNTYGSGALDFPNYPEVNLSVISGACSQVSGSLAFRVTRSGSLNNPLTVTYSLVSASLVNGIDYQSLTGTVTIPANAASADIVVYPIWSNNLASGNNSGGNNLPELSVQLGAGASYVLGANTQVKGYIAHVPWDTVGITMVQPIASESGTTATFRVERMGDTTLPITVNYVMGGSAINGLNYQPLNGQVTISSSSTMTDVVLTPIDAGTRQPFLTAIMTLVSGTDYTVGTANSGSGASVTTGTTTLTTGTATIMSANPWPTVALTTVANDASLSGSSNVLVFHVERSGTDADLLAEPMSIPFMLGGDAVSGVDFQPVTASIDNALTVVLPAGVSGTDIVITPIWTAQVKPVKLVAVQLLTGTGYTLGSNSFGQGTIDFPNYPEVNLTVLSCTASNLSATGTDALVFEVTRSGDTSKPISVNYTVGGSAVPGDDYLTLPGNIALPAGSSSTTIVVTPNWLNSVKPAKLVSIQLGSGVGYVLGPNLYGAGTINFPKYPVVNVAVISAVASQTGTNYLAFQIASTGSFSNPILINYQTGGNAVEGTDYAALPGYVVLTPSIASVGVVVLPTWAGSTSGNKLMSLQITAGDGFVLGSTTYGAGAIQLSSSSNVSLSIGSGVATSGSGQLVFHVTRTGDLTQSVAVNYSTGGSAVSGYDYLPVTGSVILGIGASTADIVVTPDWTHSTPPRPDRTVSVQLAAGTGYSLVGNTSGTGTIADLQWDTVNIVPLQSSVEENSSTTALFRVTRTGTGTRALSVNYTMAGTAQAGVNYQLLSGSVNIPLGGTSADIAVTPIDDHVNTPDLSLILALAPGQGYIPGVAASGTAVIGNVPDNSQVSLAVVTGSVSNSSSNSMSFAVTRSGNVSSAVLVNYSVGGSAVNGIDFQPVTGSVAMPAWSTSVNIVITPIWLATPKLPQVVTVQLISGNGYDLTGNTFGSGTIFYNPWDNVSLSVLQSSMNETDSATAVFQLTRTGDLSLPITVNYTTGGSAVSGVNYAALSGSATFAAGANTTQIVVTPIDDHVNTAANTLSLTLATGTNYNASGIVSGAVSINNVPDNILWVGVASQASESGHNGVFVISRSGAVDQALTVYYAVSGNAVPGRDYTTLSGVATFPVGASAALVTVQPIANTTTKISPTVKIKLNPSTNYTIVDPRYGSDNGIVTISHYFGPILSAKAIASSVSVTSGAHGVFRISRVGSLTSSLPVKYTMGGTAINGTDYKRLSGSTTIPAKKSYVDVTLVPVNRNRAAGLYTATLTVVSNGRYIFTPANAATVSIQSYGPAPVSVAADPAATSNWEGYGLVRAIFTRTGSTSDALTVHYSTGGTAVAGVNFAAVSGAVTFPAGQSTTDVVFNTIDDGKITADMSLVVYLINGAGYVPTSPTQCTLTIKDADLKGPSF